MPLYEFEIRNSRTGAVLQTTELSLPIENRDVIEIVRQLPSSVGVAGAARNPMLQGNQVLDACKRLENRLGSSEFERRMGMKSDTVKRAWAGQVSTPE